MPESPTGVDSPRRRRRSVSLGAVRSGLAPSMHKPGHV